MLAFLADHLGAFANGALITLQYTAASCLFGAILAVPIALMRLSRRAEAFWPATAYVFFFRGTPLLAQIFLIYYGSGQFRQGLESLGLWSLFREPWFCAVLTLSLNTGAYSSEIVRGALLAVPHGEVEAAMALGLSPLQRLRLVVLPRALAAAWPAYTNEIVYQIQATSLVSIITVMDITGVARVIASRNFAFYEAFATAAAFYLAIVYLVILVAKRIEKRLHAHLDEVESVGKRIGGP
ncbi:amino acid ABC transporter membrane protein 2, PAAT family [Tistlia consotensis]|uniref:Amino acid ABC transporter membrane protein 2, PAAT family n=1 Tax=Tistlia consotensis USBA 355 TaxID=560819 RepID=A0A1Y6CSQ5_9PROT|nr:ABC transporter permease [Tistlia consotensis]SMF71039.1 amino acid ABC transporter membrane protein 2, PAAT family [Tistlia consotensis USBA 355]SNS06829.1 amino acid ABC transporter membrane protein 2, PAAT family [Tistlia consotensis]